MKHASSPQDYLNKAIDELKNHNLDASRRILGDSLFHHFDNPTLLGMMKYVAFWQEREKLVRNVPNNFQKCDILLEQWANFQNFIRTIQFNDDRSLYGIRQYVFGSALNFLSCYNNEQGLKDPEILYRVGLCLKLLGDYQAAQRFLESANSLRKSSPAILAELGDTCAFLEEMDLSKVFFREAFSIEPQDIRLEFLESALIGKVINLVAEEGFAGDEIPEWVPVYGYLHGVLNVRRELRAVEYGKLRQAVYQLEREISEGIGDRRLKIPRVLNKYFWLIDYHSRSRDEDSHIRDLLLKIKGFSPKVWELYTR